MTTLSASTYYSVPVSEDDRLELLVAAVHRYHSGRAWKHDLLSTLEVLIDPIVTEAGRAYRVIGPTYNRHVDPKMPYQHAVNGLTSWDYTSAIDAGLFESSSGNGTFILTDAGRALAEKSTVLSRLGLASVAETISAGPSIPMPKPYSPTPDYAPTSASQFGESIEEVKVGDVIDGRAVIKVVMDGPVYAYRLEA